MTDAWRQTPLSYAAQNGHLEIVKFLVKEGGTDVESKNYWQQTLLSCAAWNGHLEIVKFLVNEAGADVKANEKGGNTVLDLSRQGTAKGLLRAEQRKGVTAWLESEMANCEGSVD